MTLTYLCTLDLPDEWFAELAERVPDVGSIGSASASSPPQRCSPRSTCSTRASGSRMPPQVPSLRCVQLDTSGVDHVRRTSLWDTDIPIATLGGIAPVPMAEYALMTILELAHRMPRIQQLRDARAWPTNADRLARLTPRELAGATVGIVGYGRIGREISRLASAFGMRVLGAEADGVARRRRPASSTPAAAAQATTRPSCSRWTASTRCSRRATSSSSSSRSPSSRAG